MVGHGRWFVFIVDLLHITRALALTITIVRYVAMYLQALLVIHLVLQLTKVSNTQHRTRHAILIHTYK